MNKKTFLTEVASQLEAIYKASKSGLKPGAKARHRCEGFMHAGEFMGVASREELSALMEQCHQKVFGESIAEREAQKKRQQKWSSESVDYSEFESPAFDRKR
ncbi:hypothetical protein [Endozoicomonas lisbonensis]|uniref:Uncharacterized protein n=1 Tax=Endozoicomonas lisbonensis TaxID=3120522 RepID=A0ABV2SDZ3_9GAMM